MKLKEKFTNQNQNNQNQNNQNQNNQNQNQSKILQKKEADQKEQKIKTTIKQVDQNKSKFDEIINSNKSYVNILVGSNETGKSSYLFDMISLNKGRDIIYISPYVSEQPEIENNILFINPKSFFLIDSELLKDSIIVFDDCKSYISTSTEHKDTKILNNLLIQRRYLKLEFYIVFHSFSQIPTFLYDFVTIITIKKTTDNLQKLKNRRLYFDEILELQTEL